MTPHFEAFLAETRNRTEETLFGLLKTATHSPDTKMPAGLREACRYTLEVGGKRIRPVLCYAAARAVGGTHAPGVDEAAAALELIHTYSLIHDDLPAMDDDDLRRGKPTLHRVHGEATAILAGDALQAMAFGILAEAPDIHDNTKIEMLKTLATASGPEGMVGGQFIDVHATDTELTLDALSAMHTLKTGALIQAAVALGAIAGGGSLAQRKALQHYAQNIGLAFQVVDDILDVEGDTATLGKTQGKDTAANKPTYVQLLGLSGARTEATRLLAAALDSLETFSEAADPLRTLATYIVERDR